MDILEMWNKNMNKKMRSGLVAGMIAALSFASTPAIAQQRTSNHTLGSGPDVYRVEVRNLNRFEVLEAGDSDGVGELHEMKISLYSFNQADTVRFTGTELYLLNEGGIVGGDRYFPIRVGQHVFTETDRRPDDTTQMWVHVDAATETTNTVYLGVSGQELDCVGQRVCGRRSNGSVTIHFTIPDFSRRPSNVCGPDNTFRLEPLDGEIQISGLSGTSVWSGTNSESWYLGFDHEAGGPRLRPFNAEICIASTIRP
jgi:hypothetical protein